MYINQLHTVAQLTPYDHSQTENLIARQKITFKTKKWAKETKSSPQHLPSGLWPVSVTVSRYNRVITSLLETKTYQALTKFTLTRIKLSQTDKP